MAATGESDVRATGQARSAGVDAATRMCLRCGYNLHGLPVGGRCPECGLPIVMPGEIDEPLCTMPIGIIRTFQAASWLASACALGLIVLVIAERWMLLGTPAPAALLAAFSLLWAAAVWLLTGAYDMPQALFHGFSSTGRLRLWARGLQAGWVLAAGAAFLKQAAAKTAGGGILPTLLGSTSVLGIAIGLAGIVVLAIQLRRLAEWARDSNAERALNLTAWGIPITTPLLFVNLPILLLGLALGLIWVTSVCAFVYALFSLSGSLTWSVRHAREYQDRLRRQRRRAEEYGEEVAGAVAEMDAARARRDKER